MFHFFVRTSSVQVSVAAVDNQDLELNEIHRFELLRNELIELEKRVQRSTNDTQNEEVSLPSPFNELFHLELFYILFLDLGFPSTESFCIFCQEADLLDDKEKHVPVAADNILVKAPKKDNVIAKSVEKIKETTTVQLYF